MTGAGALRDEQHRLSNPASIPYHDLFTISSLILPEDGLTISILLIPTSNTTSDELTSTIARLDAQSLPPISYHVLPLPGFDKTDIPSSISPTLPNTEEAHYTILLPLSSDITFGPNVLETLLHLSGTREFSGALLEIGCQQAAFVQTTWLDQLQFGRSDMPWNSKGVSSIKLPLADRENGLNGFWVDGLKPCIAPVPNEATTGLAAIPGAAQIKFFVEPDEDEDIQWYGGWKELVCEFATRRNSWTPALYVVGGNDVDVEENVLWCDADIAVSKTAIDPSAARTILENMDPQVDVLIYVLGGFVAHEMARGGLLTDLTRRMAVIGLPKEDLAHALWMGALSPEALSSQSRLI